MKCNYENLYLCEKASIIRQKLTLGQEDPLEKGTVTHSSIFGASLVVQVVKTLPAIRETRV